jgi:1,4-alpha-glucan branching enzyme
MNKLQPSTYDQYIFNQGSLLRSYETMGAHFVEEKGITGVRFSVWAPNAKEVRLVGDFNEWQGNSHRLKNINNSGIWFIFVPELEKGTLYKYEIYTKSGEVFFKSDPYAFYSEVRPNTASIVHGLPEYEWNDQDWLVKQNKNTQQVYNQPILIYEVHLGSWKRKDNGNFYTYRDLADELIDYVKKMGYTHIELLPIMEHPYDPSWGYQLTGYFSITSRFGTPTDFMYFVDRCHYNGIGVILDWVPGHFGKDAHGLRMFDGTPLYEYSNSLKAEKHSWGTLSFDYTKPEVTGFLISNALFWFDIFHIDGLRVDAVTSMLQLDFDKENGQWEPNVYGGRDNLEAIEFLKKLNKTVFQFHPGALMMAEESTDYPSVTGPVHLGGLGFNYKWSLGWMNDTLTYMEKEHSDRKNHHKHLTFPLMYAFTENFTLPISHDEVVHGKKSLLDKMPGDYNQKFANLRLCLGYMMTHPGKKLLFMGSEFGQFSEWRDQDQLDWNLLDYEMHRKVKEYTKDLNHFYLKEKGLWEQDHIHNGYEWINPHDAKNCIISYIRKGKKPSDSLIVICNFSTKFHKEYRIGVQDYVHYHEVFSSDDHKYGGGGHLNIGYIKSEKLPSDNQPFSLTITLAPLSMIILKKSVSKKKRTNKRVQLKPITGTNIKGGRNN